MNPIKMDGLRTTIYVVPDLSAAKLWYRKAFNAEAYFDEIFYVGFNIGGYELGLLPEEGQALASGENVLSYWGVQDIQSTFNHLLNCGATVHEDPHSVGGAIMVATVKDPWGNVIGIIYNPHFAISN